MKKLISLLLTATMLLSVTSGIGLMPHAQALAAEENPRADLRLWYDKPAAGDYNGWENESLPIGNSSIGGNVFGRYDTERITLNEKTFWTGGPSDKRPHYMGGNLPEKGRDGAALKEIQDLFLDGNAEEGSARMDRDLIGAQDGYGGYQMFGNLYLDFGHKDVTHYKRELRIMEGLASVDYDIGDTHYAREYLASFPDQVMAVHLTAEGSGTLDFSVRLEPENTAPATRKFTITGDDTSLVLAGALDDNQLKFNSCLKVLLSGADAASVKKNNQLDITHAKEVTILLSMATDYKNVYDTYRTGESDAQLAARVKDVVDAASQKGYSALRTAHIKDVSSLMNRVDLDLDAKAPDMPTNEILNAYKRDSLKQNEKNYLETLLYQFGRYLLVSSSRGDTLPANLQGLWAGKNGNQWSSDYHMNVNLQMNYWPAYSGNLTECALPLINYIDSLREPGRVTAKVYFGVKSTPDKPENGFTVHTQNTPFGWTCPGWHASWGWSPAAAPWILQNCWEHYEYTGDLKFMREKIYPMLKEQVLFYSQIMRQDKDGKWISTPAYSPEHGPRTNGNTYEQSLIWQLFTDTITAAKLVGEDSDLIAKWEDILKNLHTPIEVGSSGQIKEWYHETSLDSMASEGSEGKNHRHISHMLGLFPGDLISEETPEWFKAARVSMQNRVDKSTGWAMGQRINTWARLGDGDKAYELINILLKNGILNNLWDTHTPYQIDGNFGYTSGVNEMLVQSNMGYLNILPALPKAWDHGSMNGILARGGFEIGIDWSNQTPSEIRITSHNGGPAVVQFAAGSAYTIEDDAGNTIHPETVNSDKNRISFDTEAGHTYIIKNTLPIAAPSGLEAARVDDHTIELTWNAVHGAAQYNIYRSINKGEYLLIAANITPAHFTDATAYAVSAQDSFHYKVSCTGTDGTESALSEAVSVATSQEKYVDGADASVKKSGQWSQEDNSEHYMNTNNYTWDKDAAAELTFTGTGIAAYTLAKPNYNGFYVYIDGEKQGDWHSAHASNPTPNHLIFSRMDLPYGKHTIRLEVMDEIKTGVNDLSVSLDYFKVYEKSDSVIRSVEVSSLSGVTLLSQQDQQIQLLAEVAPSDASNTAVHWRLTNADGSDTTLAEIDENGLVTAVGTGSAVLHATATSVYDSDFHATIKLNMQIPAQSADKSKLLQSLDRAALLLESDFDASGWKNFLKAQKDALAQANDPDAKENAIAAAKEALDAAMGELQVEKQLTGLKINIGSLNMSVGSEQPIQVTAIYDRGAPVNCTADAVITAEEALFTVSPEGIVHARSAGTGSLEAAYNGKEAAVSLHIVGNLNGKLTITSTSGGTVARSADAPYSVGQAVTLTAIAQDDYSFDHWEVDDTSESENPLTVTVGTNTKVHAVFLRESHHSGGSSSAGSFSNVVAVRSISLSQTTATLHQGESITLSATILPENAVNQNISWSSSDPTVAEVRDGVVTAKKVGMATITASAGRKNAVCTVTVQAAKPKEWAFTDVPEGCWYYESVKKAWSNGLIDGVSATQFNPNHTLTVAEAIKLSAALHQLDQNSAVTLSSAGAENWYTPYVTYAVKNGVIDPAYSNYTAEQMNVSVSRSELVKILHGAIKDYPAINMVADDSIPDVKSSDKNAAEIYTFFRAGILTGYNQTGTFLPSSSIKRSEVAAILIRMFDPSTRQSVTLKQK